MRSPMLGEFMGTLILVLLGDGVVAGVLLKRSKAENSGWIVIATGWGFAVLCGIFTALLFGSKAADINPAVTLAFAVESGNYATLLPYIAAQMAGGFCGAVLVWLFYLPHWRETESKAMKLGVFCTSPAIRNYPANLLCEIIATFVLVIVIGAMTSRLVLPGGGAAGVTPYLVSCVVWGIGISLGGTTGYAINPARDLAPRAAHAALPIAGKGGSDWRYAWVPVLGPVIGAIVGGLLLHLLHA